MLLACTDITVSNILNVVANDELKIVTQLSFHVTVLVVIWVLFGILFVIPFHVLLNAFVQAVSQASGGNTIQRPPLQYTVNLF